jgi:NDP-4-keto-2,6-dideoxyhexose 3-C-methyltransferase
MDVGRSCRICDGTLLSVLDLGTLALSTFPLPGEQGDRAAAPLDLGQCDQCGLVQLRHTVDPDLLFRRYWYQSGINETMVAELRSVVEQAVEIVPVGGGEVVMDVGANDGTLLAAYQAIGRMPFRVAIEPARNLRNILKSRCEQVWDCYFPDEHLTRLYYQRVHILTSIACFYDTDDPRAFVRAVEQLLAPDGVWIVQFQDLHQMLQATAFDNLCHEHLVYYALGSFERLIARYGLRVVQAEQRTINGGSLRLIVMRDTAGPRDVAVGHLREVEQGCESWQTLEQFAWLARQAQTQIRAAVRSCSSDGRTVDLYGASTKANTLLQVCDLDRRSIRQAWERSPEKIGRETITGIPIVPEGEGREDPPDVLLVGIWQFRTAILQRERAFLDRGGTILFPLPVVDAVNVRAEGI